MIPAINAYISRIIVSITEKERGRGINLKKCCYSQCIKKIYMKLSCAHIYAYTHTHTSSQRSRHDHRKTWLFEKQRMKESRRKKESDRKAEENA